MDFEKLMSGLVKEERHAQRLLFEQQGKLLFALCRRYIKDAGEAEEAMLNGFLKVYRGIAKIEVEGMQGLIAWMKRIMINECLQMLRKSHSFLVLVDAVDEEKLSEPSMDHQLSAKELFVLIDQLPPGYRAVFNLYVVEGFTHKEIAGLLKISEGASKSQLSKARQQLAHLWKTQNEYYGLGKAR